jgi:hypothetical protein
MKWVELPGGRFLNIEKVFSVGPRFDKAGHYYASSSGIGGDFIELDADDYEIVAAAIRMTRFPGAW